MPEDPSAFDDGTTLIIAQRIQEQDWDALRQAIDDDGYAVTPVPLLTPDVRLDLSYRFEDDKLYRSTIDMPRYRFGEGVYRYYRYPLPAAVAALRDALYGQLVPLANRWQELLDQPERYPERLDDLVEMCRRVGQTKPTPLILSYESGGYNCLHQDLYGEVAFPLQVTLALSQPGEDFTGGENLFVEQRPRSQSRGTAVHVPLGHAVVFPNRFRPVRGARGHYRVAVRHGVSTVHTGRRRSLGIIFHEAR
jgi:hypothetical protein